MPLIPKPFGRFRGSTLRNTSITASTFDSMAAAAAGLLELLDDHCRGFHISLPVDGNGQPVLPGSHTPDGKLAYSSLLQTGSSYGNLFPDFHVFLQKDWPLRV